MSEVSSQEEDAMTVAELIEQLQRLPADLPVYIVDWNEGYAPDCPMTAEIGPRVSASYDHPRGILELSLPERVLIGMTKEPTSER